MRPVEIIESAVAPGDAKGPELIQFTIRGTFQMAGVESVAPPPPARRRKGGTPWLVSAWRSCRGACRSACLSLLSVALAGAFYYFYEMPQQVEIGAAGQGAQRHPRPHQPRPVDGASTARVQEGDRRRSKRGSSRSSRFCLTNETWATCCGACRPWRRSRICRCAASGPQAITTKEMHAEWPISSAARRAAITTSGCSSIASASFRESSTSAA